jgi:hypothetical protein
MHWNFYVAYFFGGAFGANAMPHLIAGVSGKPFHSPFASPPFRGLSSPTVNVAWGLFNLALAYALLLHVGEFEVRSWLHAAVCFAGFGAMAFQIVRSLGRMKKERERASPSTTGTP